MQEYSDRIKSVVHPLIYAINRHDKSKSMKYLVGGDVILDAAISHPYYGDVSIYLEDINKGDEFYSMLKEMGYAQVEQTDWIRRFKNLNNHINVMHFKSFTSDECVINSELTVESCFIDNSFTMHYRPEFFDDLKKKNIKIVHLHEPSSGIEYRIYELKERGFKLLKASEKVLNLYNRGVDYKKQLTPILPDAILTS